MRARGLGWYATVSGITVGLLVGCGGGNGYMAGMGNMGGMNGTGGMGGYGSMPAPMPMPTMMFTAPAQATTINLGQAVKLTWSSQNATSCSAAASSMIGGSFTGTQSTSGSATVAPTGTGTVTYTLTCMGPGGSGSATTATVTVNPSILSTLALTKITAIGPTADPIAMESNPNPNGLTLAPVTAGLVTKGDLLVCNFNDAGGTKGHGTTLVGLHPTPGSTPYRIAQSPALSGCNALTTLADGTISAAAWTANQNPLVAPDGTVSTAFSADSFANPWGEAYVAAKGQNPAALYVSNSDGSIDRITLNADTQTAFTQIASGFCGSGQPGAIYAPSGLTYDASTDTLYIVDTSSFSVVAFANVSSIGAGGVVVAGQCQSASTPPTPLPTFSGPSASSASIIAHDSQFVAPISAALLSDGNLIVANSDINLPGGATPNLVFEISPVFPGGVVGQPIQLDSGNPGALFGLATAVDAQGHQIVYFNDDNANKVMMITP